MSDGRASAAAASGADHDGPGARRLIERALARRSERPSPWSDLGEPDRHAAVVLVLRPGEGVDPAGRAPAGETARPHRVVADGTVGTEAPVRGEPAPLFPRPLVPPLRSVEALFIVRVEREGDPWSGQVGLPGGHAEAVDADLRAAALRELEEEAGLTLSPAAVLGRLEEIRPRSRRLPSVAVTPFVAWHGGGSRVEPGVEAAGHFWAPLAELESPRVRTVLTFRREGALRAFPGIDRGAGVVWGLTFALVRRFLSLLPRGDAPPRGGRAGSDAGADAPVDRPSGPDASGRGRAAERSGADAEPAS